MKIVNQLRAGAPDKINIWTDGSYILKKHDGINLVDYDAKQLTRITNRGEYILPADEGDLYWGNQLEYEGFEDWDKILLPQTLHTSRPRLIDADYFVPKSSKVYRDLYTYTGMSYSGFTEYKADDIDNDSFRRLLNQEGKDEGIALKSVTGSGSRGVILIDPSKVGLGGKYVSEMSVEQYAEILSYARSECEGRVMVQDMIPTHNDLVKTNVDFIIRDGELLGYKWTNPDPSAVFTNWNWGYFNRNSYTDELMSRVARYLTKTHGIENAIMNFEAFSNMKDETWMIEFNWRYSNSMFEGQALGIDFIGKYLHKIPFGIPHGTYKFSRYWQCELYNEIKGYHYGK